MSDTTPDQAAIESTAGIIGADRVARSDGPFRGEVRVLLAALVAATAP
jgi:hypothetical protein